MQPLSLRGRLLGATLGIVTLAYGAVWAMVATAARDGVSAITDSNLQLQSKNLGDTLSSILEDSHADAVTSAQLDLTKEALDTGDPKNFVWYANEMVRNKGRYAALVLTDVAGKIVATNTKGPSGERLGTDVVGHPLGRPWLAKALGSRGGGVFIPPERPAALGPLLPSDEQVVGYCLPVFDLLGDTLGTLAVLISMGHLEERLSRFTSTSDGFIDAAALLATSAGAPLALPKLLRDTGWNENLFPSEGEGTVDMKVGAGAFRVTHTAVRVPLAPGNWRVVLATRAEHVQAAFKRLNDFLIICFIAALVLTTLVLVYLAKAITDPIRRTVELALGVSGRIGQVSRETYEDVRRNQNQTESASHAVEDITANVRSVAASMQEMSVSIREISANAQRAARVADDAGRSAAEANGLMEALAQDSTEISKVTKDITAITEKTNLLALNATIEAARAGDLGKGFAVVATEVKELAREAAKAAEGIRKKIAAVQKSSSRSVEAMADIGRVVTQVNDFQRTIAAAVEEQNIISSEMEKQFHNVAMRMEEIAASVSEVAKTTESNAGRSDEMRRAATDLGDMAKRLQRLISGREQSTA